MVVSMQRLTWLSAGLMCLGGLMAPAWAEQTAKDAAHRLEGLQIQPGDEPLQIFEPEHAPSAQSEAQRAAMAHYMQGRIAQEHGRFSEALEAYLAAIEKDPKAIAAYKGALPILLQRQEMERARKLTLDAARQQSEGIELVLAMGAVFARQDQLSEGIQLLKAALELPDLKPRSLQELYLRRDLGLYYRMQADYAKSATEYQVVFDAVTDPALDADIRDKLLGDAGETFDEFGDIFLKAELPDLALKAFDEASKHRPARPGVHSFNLAAVFQQTGKPEKALEELQGYFDAQLQTRGRAAYELLKTLLTELKRPQELLPRLEEMHKSDEHNDVLRFFLADEFLEKGDLKRAQELYTQGRENVSDPRALVGMLSIYRQQQQSEKLLKTLTKAMTSVPRGNEPAILQQLAPDLRDLAIRFEHELTALEKDEPAFTALTKYARTLEEGDEPKLEFLQAYLLGKLSAEADRTDDAVHFYKFAISMRNDPPSTLFTELASELIDAQHYAEATAILDEAIAHPSTSLQRDKWRFLYLLSYSTEFQGETERALKAIREAQRLQPNVPSLHYQEAWVVSHARRWDEALVLFEQVINNSSGDKDLAQKCRFHVSNIYVEKGDAERGIQILEEILADDPDNVQANNDLGYLFADRNMHLERAEGMIRKALAEEPENYAYLDSLGWVLYRQGKYAEALEPLQKATGMKNGDDSTIVEHLGDCLAKLNRQPEAVDAWKRALANEEAKHPPSEKVLKSLRQKLGIKATAESKTPAGNAAPATSEGK